MSNITVTSNHPIHCSTSGGHVLQGFCETGRFYSTFCMLCGRDQDDIAERHRRRDARKLRMKRKRRKGYF